MTAAVFAWPGQESIAAAIAREVNAEVVAWTLRRFPDGETYVRIDAPVNERSVLIVCTMRDPDPLFLPLLFLAQTARELGAAKVGLVAPYLAYMRQDKRFQAGEAVTSAIFARLLSGAFDWLVTLDPHLHRHGRISAIYGIPSGVAHAAPTLAQWVRTNVARPVIVGPDSESEQWVAAVASDVPAPHVVLQKVRRGDRDVAISRVPEIERWRDHTPVLLDDIISSGRTMIEVVMQWIRAGHAPPVCLAVHAVFADLAFEALQQAGAIRIVSCNSIPHPSNAIDISHLLAAEVQRLRVL